MSLELASPAGGHLAAASNAQLGLDFLRKATTNTSANVVLSPVSLQIVLGLILLGTDNDSCTERELLKLLGYDHEHAGARATALHRDLHRALGAVFKSAEAGAKSDALSFELANLVLANADMAKLSADYANDTKRYYRNTKVDDFGSSQLGAALSGRVNAWAAATTNNQITSIIDAASLSSTDLALVLLNAAYFKGKWLHEFPAGGAGQEPFYNRGSEPKPVPFMRTTDHFGYADLTAGIAQEARQNLDADEKPSEAELKRLRLAERLDCRVLSMPFALGRGKELDMVLVLPEKRDGLAGLLANLDGASLSAALAELDAKIKVRVELPKFAFESAHDAKAVLTELGLERVFSDSAELGRMFETASGHARVSKMLHKARIGVDERGAEAAAATVAVVTMRSGTWPLTHPFRADHPFLFVVRHKPTGLLLFVGVVTTL